MAITFLATPALATPAERLAEAREAFRLGHYDEAIPLLNYLLYPDARLSSTTDLVEAHILLGVSHFELGNRLDARREFEEALFLDDNVTLDSLLFSESAVAYFRERKQAFIDRAQRDEEIRALAEERERLRSVIENMIVIERRPYYINFVPMGAGQFQNGHNGKGIFFFVSQAVLGGTSLGLWVWQVNKYGGFLRQGFVPTEDIDLVNRLQIVQISTGGACAVLVFWGVIDSLINYESTTRRPADESLLPADFKPSTPQPKSSWKLAPAPSGLGVVMSMEF